MTERINFRHIMWLSKMGLLETANALLGIFVDQNMKEKEVVDEKL